MIKALFIAFLLAFFSGCGSSNEGAETLSFSPETQNKLQQILEEKTALTGASGAVLLVREDSGKEWSGAIGVARSNTPKVFPDDRGNYSWQGSPMEKDLLFRIGSLTKMFTAALILKLMEEGKLNIEDKLEHWLPGAVKNSEIITLKQLLNHTSGVVELNAGQEFSEFKAWTPESLLALIKDKEPQFKPGEHSKYTNSNYILLGMVAQKVTGQTYEELIQEKLLKPLWLSHTYVPRTGDFPEANAYGYILQEKAFVEVSGFQPSAPWSAGAMISNMYDLSRWIQSLFGGFILDPKSLEMMQTFTPMTETISYGLGLMRLKDGRVGHSGAINGFYSGAWKIDRYTIVAITNSQSDMNTADILCDTVAEIIQDLN